MDAYIGAMTQTVCRGYQCNGTRLIRAHIIPRGFARDMQAGHSHNLKISMDQVQVTQHGVYDPGILCESCDGELGKLDDYALEICRRFPHEHEITADDWFLMENVDGDQFAKFVLSVLWRASITRRTEFRRVSLGPYEARASEVIFGAKPLRSMAEYELLIGRYKTVGRFNPASTYTSPARSKFEGANGWAFALNGFRIMAKIDKRPLPLILRSVVVNGNKRLVGIFGDFHSTSEGKAMMQMRTADIARLARRAYRSR